jgi:hypothetical protein
MQIREIAEALEDIRTEVLVLFHLEDEPAPRGHLGRADWILLSALSHLRVRGKFAGARGAAALFSPNGKLKAERVLVVGLGPRGGFSKTALYRLSYQVAQTILSLGCTDVALDLPFRAFPHERPDRIRRAFLEGFTAELRRGRPGITFTVGVLSPPDGN